MKTILKIAIQKSGRLANKTFDLLKNAGFDFEMTTRILTAKCRNFPLEILFFRAGDIPEIVSDGTADIGICGQNSVAESGLKLCEIEKLGFGKCRLSIAAPETFFSKNKPKLKNLNRKKIATSDARILKNFCRKNQLDVEIVELSGSVEIAPNLGIADAICDLVSTGSTLKMNGLRECFSIFESEAVLVSSGNSETFSAEKSKLLNKFLVRLRAVILAKKFKYIVFNLPRKNVEKLCEILPGLESPTISDLADKNWVSVATVAAENDFWNTVEKLKNIGAAGILVTPIEKMIL